MRYLRLLGGCVLGLASCLFGFGWFVGLGVLGAGFSGFLVFGCCVTCFSYFRFGVLLV